MNHPDFDDLEDEIRDQYILEAFEELDADNQIPYGVSTGDYDTIYEYEPVLNLARLNYDSSFEDD